MTMNVSIIYIADTVLVQKFFDIDNIYLLIINFVFTYSTWLFQLRSSSTIIPKNRVELTFDSKVSLILILNSFPSDQNLTRTVLLTFRDNWFALNQSVSKAISHSRLYLRKLILLLLNRVISSAKRIMLLKVGNRCMSL